MRESRFTIVEVDRTADPMIVYIKDLNGPVSVTNDAENVLRRLRYDSGDFNARVVYKDTTGEWWEMYKSESQNWMGQGLSMKFRPWNGRVWDVLSN